MASAARGLLLRGLDDLRDECLLPLTSRIVASPSFIRPALRSVLDARDPEAGVGLENMDMAARRAGQRGRYKVVAGSAVMVVGE